MTTLPFILSNNLSAADRAVIVVHGVDRNANDYYKRMVTAAKRAGVDKSTFIIAPNFAGKSWPDTWKQGGNKAFQEMDKEVALLRRRPNLKQIIIAGHSAGAQFVQRYSVFGQQRLDGYFAANASSYVYADEWRPVKPKKDCRFNNYRYGLRALPSYLPPLVPTYNSRNLLIVNGAKDVRQDDDLDVSCAAMAQGENRLERGVQFAMRHGYSWLGIPGVAHDSAAIFNNPLSWPALFGVTPR